MEISHASHPHNLELKPANCPYYCGACDQIGFGLTYTCIKGCNFFIHELCGKPKRLIEYPFSQKCVLKFRDGGPGVDCACDACGKIIKRFHYRCVCTFQKRHLHPSCLNYEKTLEAAFGLTMHLQKAAASKCLHCHTTNLWSKVRGWAYVSSCGTYSYHVSCVKEIINKNWRHAFFTGKSDPFWMIKEKFPEDKDRMHKLVVVQKNKQTRKQAIAVLSIILHVFTGNYLGLVGTAVSYFGN